MSSKARAGSSGALQGGGGLGNGDLGVGPVEHVRCLYLGSLVPTAAYLPYCFFNILSPILDVIYGYVGFKVPQLQPSSPEGETALLPDVDRPTRGRLL